MGVRCFFDKFFEILVELSIMRMKYGINGKYCYKNMYIVKSYIL